MMMSSKGQVADCSDSEDEQVPAKVLLAYLAKTTFKLAIDAFLYVAHQAPSCLPRTL